MTFVPDCLDDVNGALERRSGNSRRNLKKRKTAGGRQKRTETSKIKVS